MPPRPTIPAWHHAQTDAFSPDRPMVRRWLDAYVAAWKSYDETEIADLWTKDAVWAYPFRVRATGREAITAEWMAEKEVFVGRGYDAAYAPIAIDGPFAVTHGRTLFFDVATGTTQAEVRQRLGPPVRAGWTVRRVPRMVRRAPRARSDAGVAAQSGLG